MGKRRRKKEKKGQKPIEIGENDGKNGAKQKER